MVYYTYFHFEKKEMWIDPRNTIGQSDQDRFISEIKSKIERHAPKSCVLDFSSVIVSNEIAMNIISGVLSIMEEQNGKLMVCNMRESLMKAFTESDVSKKVEILEDDE